MTTLVIADPDDTFWRGFRLLIESQSEFKILAETADAQEALKLTLDLNPDILLLELRAHSLGIETAIATIAEQKKNTRVVILAENCDKQNVSLAIKPGVCGFIDKSVDSSEILDALRAVSLGKVSFPPLVAQTWLAHHNTVGQGPNGRLTNRETEVLIHIAEGKSNKEIASHLAIGVRTVETHRERVMRKLDIHSIAGLTRYAVSNGLVPLTC